MPTTNVNLTDEQDAFVERMVKSGKYQNASEAMRDAVRGLQQRWKEDLKLKALRKLVGEGASALERSQFEDIDDAGLDTHLDRLAGPAARCGMARYRLSGPATADIAEILRSSEDRHGRDARLRYRGLLSATLRRIASDPEGRSTSERGEILAGLRSFHIRHSRNESLEAPVAAPVHVIFYRAVETGIIEIVRVLHERVEPSGRIAVDRE